MPVVQPMRGWTRPPKQSFTGGLRPAYGSTACATCRNAPRERGVFEGFGVLGHSVSIPTDV